MNFKSSAVCSFYSFDCCHSCGPFAFSALTLLDGRREEHLVSNVNDEVLTWLSVWDEMQMICIWSSWCHCQRIISYFIKIQNSLTLSGDGLSERSLSGCLSVAVMVQLTEYGSLVSIGQYSAWVEVGQACLCLKPRRTCLLLDAYCR